MHASWNNVQFSKDISFMVSSFQSLLFNRCFFSRSEKHYLKQIYNLVVLVFSSYTYDCQRWRGPGRGERCSKEWRCKAGFYEDYVTGFASTRIKQEEISAIQWLNRFKQNQLHSVISDNSTLGNATRHEPEYNMIFSLNWSNHLISSDHFFPFNLHENNLK